MEPIYLTFLNGPDIESLRLTDDEILGAVEGGLRAQGCGEIVIEPRVHLLPRRGPGETIGRDFRRCGDFHEQLRMIQSDHLDRCGHRERLRKEFAPDITGLQTLAVEGD